MPRVRSKQLHGQIILTVLPSKVGVWAGSDSATVKFSDFRVLNMAAAAEVDGRWYDDAGDTSLASGKLQMNVVTGMGSTGIEKHALRRGFRGSKFVMEFDGPVSSSADLGAILHYQNPENFMAVVFSVEEGSSYTPLLLRRKGGVLSTIASNSPFTMTSGDRVRLAIHDDPANAALQELKVYVNGTLRLTSDKIDDDWSGGAVGLITRNATVSASFDNVKIGFDNNANDDVDDGGDTVLVNDDFASGTITLSHDKAGNLTDDGVFQYVYDAWNRLVGVKTSQGSHATIATYSYDGLNRRVRKVVTNTGSGLVDQSDAGGVTGIQAGDKTEDYFYAGWRVLEERDGDGKTLAQTVYGTQYIDEPLCRDRNTDIASDNDCVDSGGSQRYFYQQDANYRVVALTSESGGVVERYEYEAYGEPRIYQGAGSGSELGYLMQVSGVGNALMLHGAAWDIEASEYSMRLRALSAALGQFVSRDGFEYVDGLSLYNFASASPQNMVDPFGLWPRKPWWIRPLPRPKGPAGDPSNAVVCWVSYRSRTITCQLGDEYVTCPIVVPSGDDPTKDKGPLPQNEYLIEPPYKNPRKGKRDWCQLNPLNDSKDGYRPYNGKDSNGRCFFALHPGNVSWGCVTVPSDDCWSKLSDLVNRGGFQYGGKQYQGTVIVIDGPSHPPPTTRPARPDDGMGGAGRHIP